MPATYTHHVFAKDVYKIIDSEIQNKLKNSKTIFEMFSKSFDILFFSKNSLGNNAHAHFTNLYFKNIINYMIDNSLTCDSDVLAYLYGSLCHYILDSTTHPYIFYKTGNYQGDKKTFKYKGKHSYLEYMIDAIMYQEKEAKPIYKANLKKELFPKIMFSENLQNTINYAFVNTFNVGRGNILFLKGYRNYKFVIKHVMTSRFGIKNYFYKLMDFTHIIKSYQLSNLCYHIRNLDYSVLNLEHRKWFYPVSNKISYHYSFNDLYDISLEKVKKLINMLDKFLNSNNENDLNKVLKEIGNLSYVTGIDCDRKSKMKYFEF